MRCTKTKNKLFILRNHYALYSLESWHFVKYVLVRINDTCIDMKHRLTSDDGTTRTRYNHQFRGLNHQLNKSFGCCSHYIRSYWLYHTKLFRPNDFISFHSIRLHICFCFVCLLFVFAKTEVSYFISFIDKRACGSFENRFEIENQIEEILLQWLDA